MELCQGTVDDYIKGKLKSDVLLMMPHEPNALNQIARGLEYIHQESFVHRDIKPANMLILTNSSGTATLKISDFGLTKPVTERSKNFTGRSGAQGTLEYMAPEYRQLKDKSESEKKAFRANVNI